MREKEGRVGWGGCSAQSSPSCCINLQIFSDDAKTVTLPRVPSLPLHLHIPPLSVSLPMPRSRRMGDSDTQQVSMFPLVPWGHMEQV